MIYFKLLGHKNINWLAFFFFFLFKALVDGVMPAISVYRVNFEILKGDDINFFHYLN